ncbi:hypothetical protein [Acidisoma sp. 7E03]
MFRLLSYRIEDHVVSISGTLGRLILQLSVPMTPGRAEWTAEQWADALLYELATLVHSLNL